MTPRIAEVLYPSLPEIGIAKVGAWISDAGKVTGAQRRKLQDLLPSNADLMYHDGVFRIEADVSPEKRDRASAKKLAKTIRAAILKGLGVKAGLCPVTSSAKVLHLTRRA